MWCDSNYLTLFNKLDTWCLMLCLSLFVSNSCIRTYNSIWLIFKGIGFLFYDLNMMSVENILWSMYLLLIISYHVNRDSISYICFLYLLSWTYIKSTPLCSSNKQFHYIFPLSTMSMVMYFVELIQIKCFASWGCLPLFLFW
jgi:hypothetical protein